jgi:hypothetical protein
MKVFKLLMGFALPTRAHAFSTQACVQELTPSEIQQVAGGARVNSNGSNNPQVTLGYWNPNRESHTPTKPKNPFAWLCGY